MVDSEKTAQSTPRNAGPRFLPLAVVCNGLLSIAQRRWRTALIVEAIALDRKMRYSPVDLWFGNFMRNTVNAKRGSCTYFDSGEIRRKPGYVSIMIPIGYRDVTSVALSSSTNPLSCEMGRLRSGEATVPQSYR